MNLQWGTELTQIRGYSGGGGGGGCDTPGESIVFQLAIVLRRP